MTRYRSDLLVLESWLTSALDTVRTVRVTILTDTAERTLEQISEAKTDIEIALDRIGKLEAKLTLETSDRSREEENSAEDFGSACGQSCGYCGMCSAR